MTDSNSIVVQLMARKMRRAFEAAQAMGERCGFCGDLFRPNDEGADLDGTTVWSVTCCGVRHEWVEKGVDL